MCYAPVFYANNLEKVRAIIVPVIEDYNGAALYLVFFSKLARVEEKVRRYMEVLL